MSNLRIEKFRELHRQDSVLILANAWDAGSARVIEDCGAKAIATTSAGVGWAYGYPDGDALPAAMLAILASHITDVVRVPVTVDVEGAYTNDPKEVETNLAPIFDTGISGINLEDGEAAVQLTAKKIAEARRTAKKLGIDIFINVRTDVYLREMGKPETRVEETIRRAKIYREAGGDGLFVPAICNKKDIAAIVPEIKMPLNVMAWPGLPCVDELKPLGVKRLSSGSGIPQIVWQKVADLAKSFLNTGDSKIMSENYMAHAKLQGLFER